MADSPVTRNELRAINARKRMARLVAAAFALLLAMVTYGGIVVYEQGQANERNQRDVARILEDTEERDDRAKADLARFVAETNEEIRKALAEHDRSTKVYLARNLRLTEAEVNAPENQEDAGPRASSVPSVRYVEPAPRPAPAPAPAPIPDAPGKSDGKGKKKK